MKYLTSATQAVSLNLQLLKNMLDPQSSFAQYTKAHVVYIYSNLQSHYHTWDS